MQQVNLYKDSLRARQDAFPSIYAVYSIAGLLLLLFSLSVFKNVEVSTIENDIAQLKKTQMNLNKQVSTLVNSISTQDNTALENILVEKEGELAHKKIVLETLKGRTFGNKKGFADHLTGFAVKDLNGLWMTEFHIYNGGQDINIKGQSLTPELVPTFLVSLSKVDSFSGIQFDSFLLEKNEGKYISFVLVSEVQDERDN